MSPLEKLIDGFDLIEGPVWDSEMGLIFSDAVDGGVYTLSGSGKCQTIFEHRRGIGGIAQHEAGGLIVSGRNISFKSFSDAETITLLDRNESEGIVGFNDLTVDDRGRVYAGSLGRSPANSPTVLKYRLTFSGPR